MAAQFVQASLQSWRSGQRAFEVLHTGVDREHLLKVLLRRCGTGPSLH